LLLLSGNFDFFKGSLFSFGSVDNLVELFLFFNVISFGVFGGGFFGVSGVFSDFSEDFGH